MVSSPLPSFLDVKAPRVYAKIYVTGLIHPLIHLGFGIEFNQPAIVAQALAQTAVHDEVMGPAFFLPVEKLAGGIGKPGKKSLLQLLNEIRENEALRKSAHWSDPNKMRDGVLSRAPDEMFNIAAQYTVAEDQVGERLADMINTVGQCSGYQIGASSNIANEIRLGYFTSTAQRRDKEVKFDFFLIHSLNSSIFFSRFIELPYLTQKTKLRLLEWKGRLDLLLYASRASPDLLLDEVTQYPAKNDWPAVFARSVTHPSDDGHLVKLVRALANGEKACQPYESQGPQVMPISGDMWLRIGNMGEFTVHSGMIGKVFNANCLISHRLHC